MMWALQLLASRAGALRRAARRTVRLRAPAQQQLLQLAQARRGLAPGLGLVQVWAQQALAPWRATPAARRGRRT